MGSVRKLRSGKYQIDYVDGRGDRVREVVGRDRRVALMVLGERERAAEKRRAGVLDADPAQARRPIGEHVAEYADELRRSGRVPRYVVQVEARLEAIVERLGWRQLADMTPDGLREYLREYGEGRAAKSTNEARAVAVAFARWAVANHRLEAYPFESVANVKEPKTKKRRALSVVELEALFASTPEPRRTVYKVLALTGLRRSEARRLLWGHVRLGTATPSLQLPGRITKSKADEVVPLVPDVAAILANRRGDAADDDRVFRAIPKAERFKADLEAAGIEPVDRLGRVAVLHSLRHSLATLLMSTGAPVRVVQAILRHRSLDLTAGDYTDATLLPLAAAMNELPSIGEPESEPVFALATGTDGVDSTLTSVAQNVPNRGALVSTRDQTKKTQPLAGATSDRSVSLVTKQGDQDFILIPFSSSLSCSDFL